jgi:RNA polymerase sigma-70 factor (ECF subfamily)
VALEDAPDLFAHDASEASAARRDVEKLLARLPPRKRDLVRAVKLEGRSIAEEAKATGLSESVVKVTVHRAVKSLSEELGQELEGGP